jgi:hypothetical protein
VRLAPIALAVFAAVLAVAGCGGSDEKKTTRVLFPSDCQKARYKPTSIIVSCADANTTVSGIRWTSYGTEDALGSGTARVNACDPNCAAGEFHDYPARVTLSKPQDCGKDVTQFTRLALTYTGARPPSASGTFTAPFPCGGTAP